MIIDNGCNQSIINIIPFLIESFADVVFSVECALHNMAVSRLELVDNASTLVNLPNCDKVIFRLHQCYLDKNPLQTEALIQPHQA